MNWRKILLRIVRRGNLTRLYNFNIKKQYEGNLESIEKEMHDNAMNIFTFHVKYNPLYCKFLDSKNFNYSDLKSIDWTKIPIMSKDDLKNFYPEVESMIFNYTSTGGSTNSPFRYPTSKESALSMWPNHWMLHNVFGVKPYSKFLMLMAYDERHKSLKKKIYHKLLNAYTVNSFNLNELKMFEIYKMIKSVNIQFIYGYSSAINQFLCFLKCKNLFLNLKGIVCTSDNMFPDTYELAKKYCCCDAYNQYGAHDGDVFAFECEEHSGLHINHHLCTVEIIDNEIILTATQNKAFPFIRYKVGDMTDGNSLIKTRCKCGRTLFRLKNISGRVSYIIKKKNGDEISTMLFTYPFDEDKRIKQYQIVEINDKIIINLISDDYTLNEIKEKYLDFIKHKLDRDFEFIINDNLLKLKNGKIPLYIKI